MPGRSKRSRLFRILRRSDGAAIVEFAVSCIILIPMLFGFIEVCLAFYTYNFVSDAAREATRYAIVRGSTSCANTPLLANCGITTSPQIQSYVQGLGYPGLTPGNLTATLSFLRASTTTPTTWTVTCACPQPGNQVKVVVRYNFPIGIPFWKSATISIGSASSMVIAQ
jgi:Flp pilus assembly protein TadG